MDWVETTGRSIEEAKEAALDQLGVHESDAEFVVVSEPKPGLFGRMRGEARVRARVMPTSPRPKRGRTRRPSQEQRRPSGGRGRQSSGSGSGVAVADAGEVDVAVGARSDKAAGNGSSPGRGAAGNRRRRSRGGAGRGASGAGNRQEEGPGASEEGRARKARGATAGTEENGAGMTLTLEEQGESAREFVEGLIREMGLRADVSVRVVDESTAEVAVDGQELGILVGPGGATLGALQELTRTFVQKQTGGHSDRILVDVAGYRARRAEALQRFTRQVAEEVLSSGEERALEPMSAADRKVVHDTVNEIAGVHTRSEGEDPRRHIVISAASDSSVASNNDA